MTKKEYWHEQAQALLIQQHQLDQTNAHMDDMRGAIETMNRDRGTDDDVLDALLMQAEETLQGQSVMVIDDGEATSTHHERSMDLNRRPALQPLKGLDIVDVNVDASWSDYLTRLEQYASRQELEHTEDPFRHLMTDSQRIALEKRINEEFSFKAAACDKYDYMIAGTCGLIGGLVDILFVGIPGKSLLGQWADEQADHAVKGFARFNGWKGAREGSNETASAIGFLERKFGINYDHATSHATGDAVKNLSMKNHHVKSLGHSPDLMGLFFSILDQFQNTAHFVSNGQLISINTDNFELSGSNLVTKVFAGFVNWLGHLFSDMAGSQGGRGNPNGERGSGIPIPFYSLLQFLNVGAFGEDRQSFSTMAVKAFEQGYDMRHGMAMAIPVLITEILTRMMWTVKQRFYHERAWQECVPSAGNPELRRMLLIGHGTLCLVDGTDAALRSGGNIVALMIRSNLIAWARFGTLAIKELKACYAAGALDTDAVDEYLEKEYSRLLSSR